MTRKPNAIQKFLHRFFMLRPVTAFFASRVHRIDQALLRLTGGRYSGSEILGWDIILLTTVGARTRRARTVPLVGLFDEEKLALIASGFGRKHTPAWFYNLKAYPECTVQWKRKTGTFIAREAKGVEYEKYWQLAVSRYEGYARYRALASHRHIPVMVLEPKS